MLDTIISNTILDAIIGYTMLDAIISNTMLNATLLKLQDQQVIELVSHQRIFEQSLLASQIKRGEGQGVDSNLDRGNVEIVDVDKELWVLTTSLSTIGSQASSYKHNTKYKSNYSNHQLYTRKESTAVFLFKKPVAR